MICPECGAKISEAADFCPECGAAVVREEVASKPICRPEAVNLHPKVKTQAESSVGSESADAGQKLPKQFKLAEGEIIVKQYYCAKLLLPRCSGNLVVTNKRVIFHGSARNSRVLEEIPIDSVGGITISYGLKIRWLLIILGLLGIFSGISVIDIGSNMYRGGGGFIFMGICMVIIFLAMLIFWGRRRTFTLSIASSKSVGVGIAVGGGGKSIIGNGAVLSLLGKPATDTATMLNELGALVHDLQTLGDHAIDKWKKE